MLVFPAWRKIPMSLSCLPPVGVGGRAVQGLVCSWLLGRGLRGLRPESVLLGRGPGDLCRLWRGAAKSKYTKRSAQYRARRRKGHQGQPSPQALITCKGLGHHVRSNSKCQWRSVPESLVDSTPVLLQVVRAGCGLTALYPALPALWLVLLKPAINSCWRLSLR